MSKCRGSVPHSENGITKAKHKIKRTTSSFNEDTSCLGLLDSLIPFPPDFKSCNNPFRKSYKKCSSKRANSQYNKTPLTGSKRKRLTSTLNNDLAALNGNHCSDDSSSREFVSFLTTKEDLLQRTKEGELCVLGKRTTSSGMVQYLIERDR